MFDSAHYWLSGLLISTVAVLIFLYLASRDRKKIDGLEDKVRQYSRLLVESFLEREAQATRQRIKKLVVDATQPPSLETLRLCWLDAELKALVEHGRRHSNYLVLQQAALPFLRLFDKKATSALADAKSAQQKAALQLQKVRSVVSTQQSAIAEFNERKPDADGVTHNQHSATFTAALGGVEQNTATLLATISRLETELTAMQKKLAAVDNKSSAPDMTPLVITTGTQAANQNSQRELLEEIEKAYAQTLTEMARMREINKEQRKLILQLEQELSLHREDSEQYVESVALLKKLKQQLVDYENCTVILETESDTLRERIQALNRVIEDSAIDETFSETTLFNSPPLIPSSIAANSESVLLPLIEHLLENTDSQQAAAQIIALLNDRQLVASLYLKGEQESIFVSTKGAIDAHSKQLLQSLVPVVGQPIVKVKEGHLIAYPICRVLLHDDENLIHALPALKNIFKVVDDILSLTETRMESGRWRREFSGLKKRLSSMVVQHNYVASEYENIGAKFREEITDYVVSLNPSSIQQQCLERMLEDYNAQMEILTKAERLIQASLKSVTETLNSFQID